MELQREQITSHDEVMFMDGARCGRKHKRNATTHPYHHHRTTTTPTTTPPPSSPQPAHHHHFHHLQICQGRFVLWQ